MKLFRNSLLEIRPAEGQSVTHRVLSVDECEDSIFLIEVFRANALPWLGSVADLVAKIASGEARSLECDPYAALSRPEEEIPEMHKRRRDEAWSVIEPLVAGGDKIFDPLWRGQAVAEAVKRTGKPKAAIYRYLKRYWRFGQTRNALLPLFTNCGARGKFREPGEVKRGRPRLIRDAERESVGVNVGEHERNIIEQAIKLFYEKPINGHRRTLPEVYQQMLEKLCNRGHTLQEGVIVPVTPHPDEVMTFGQFKSWFYRLRDQKRGLLRREGERRFALKHREVLDDSRRYAVGPGSWFQIDSTRPGVHLVSKLRRADLIGTPVVYFVSDVFSSMIVGVTAGIENPSYCSAALAILNAAMDKTEFCRQIGMPIEETEWPSRHLCENLVADRGELAGAKGDTLVNSLGITLVNTPPFRADLKGRVERDFGILQEKLIAALPGSVRADRERGDIDPRLNAVLDVDQFRRLVVLFVLHHNRSRVPYRLQPDMIEDGVQPIPLELWEWGLKNRSGHLKKKDADVLRLNLLPHDHATVTREGIRFRGLFYTCKTALDEQWFMRSAINRRRLVDIAYDPGSSDVIFLRRNRGEPLERCELLAKDQHFRGHCWAEIGAFQLSEKISRENAEPATRQQTAAYNAGIQEIVRVATEQTTAAPNDKSKTARLSSIRAKRACERESDRANASLLELPASKPSMPKLDVEKSSQIMTSDEELNHVGPASYLDLLRKQQEEAFNSHE